MPLADFFRRLGQDPMVDAGIISKRDNRQMGLGSLAAAFGDYDRVGMLGPTLARAGAIYQGERQRTLADAFDRMKEEARARREEELYRLRLEEHYAKQDEAERELEEEKVRIEQEVVGREARRRYAMEHEFSPSAADDPHVFAAEVAAAKERTKPEKEERPHQFSDEGGSLVTIGPDGQPRIQVIPPTSSGKPLTPQERFLLERGYDPRDPAAKERYLRDEGLVSDSGGLTANGKLSLVQNIANHMIEASKDPITGRPALSFDVALRQAQVTADGVLKSFDMAKPLPKDLQGKTVAGIELPKGRPMSSPGNGATRVIQAPSGGRLDKADQEALLSITEAINSVPVEQRGQAWALLQEDLKMGKSWAAIWAEMQ